MTFVACEVQEFHKMYKQPEIVYSLEESSPDGDCFTCLFKKNRKRRNTVDAPPIISNGFGDKLEMHFFRDRKINRNINTDNKVGRMSLIGDECIYPIMQNLLDSILDENDRILLKHGIVKLILEKIKFLVCKMIELNVQFHNTRSTIRADRILEFIFYDDLEPWYNHIGTEVAELWTDKALLETIERFPNIFNACCKFLMYLIPKLVHREYIPTAEDYIKYNFYLFENKIYYEDEQRWVFDLVEICPERIVNYTKFLAEYVSGIDSLPTNSEEIIYCIDIKKFMTNCFTQGHLTNFFSFHLSQLDLLTHCANIHSSGSTHIIKKIAFMNLGQLENVHFEHFGPDFYVVTKDTLKRLIEEYLLTSVQSKKHKTNLEYIFEDSETLGQQIIKIAIFRLNLKNAGFIS
jgi:hypothetical protein